MKKVFSLIIIFVLTLNCMIIPSIAETTEEGNSRFEIRNGIYLGDDYDTVVEKNDLGSQKDDMTYVEGDDGTFTFWTETAKIAGIENAQIRYDFKDKKLYQVLYSFPEHSDRDSVDYEYSSLGSALSRKYGDALGNRNGSIDLIVSDAFSYALMLISIWEAIGGTGDIRDYDEWKYLDCDDYNVKIDLVCYYYGGSYSEAGYYNLIGYRMYSDNEYLEEIESKQNEQNEMDNDL